MIEFRIYRRISISVGKRGDLCGEVNAVDHEPRHGTRIKTLAAAGVVGDCVAGLVGND